MYGDIGRPSGYFCEKSGERKFSSLGWVERQMVEEWRTWEGQPHLNQYEKDRDNLAQMKKKCNDEEVEDDDALSFESTCVNEDDSDYDRARDVVPKPQVGACECCKTPLVFLHNGQKYIRINDIP